MSRVDSSIDRFFYLMLRKVSKKNVFFLLVYDKALISDFMSFLFWSSIVELKKEKNWMLLWLSNRRWCRHPIFWLKMEKDLQLRESRSFDFLVWFILSLFCSLLACCPVRWVVSRAFGGSFKKSINLLKQMRPRDICVLFKSAKRKLSPTLK